MSMASKTKSKKKASTNRATRVTPDDVAKIDTTLHRLAGRAKGVSMAELSEALPDFVLSQIRRRVVLSRENGVVEMRGPRHGARYYKLASRDAGLQPSTGRSKVRSRQARIGETRIGRARSNRMAAKKTTTKTKASGKAAPKKMEYVIVRTTGAGCHCGYLVDRKATEGGCEVWLTSSRRIWRWDTRNDEIKSFTLSDIALTGRVGSGGRVSPPIEKHLVTGVHEVLFCTPEATQRLIDTPVWDKLPSARGSCRRRPALWW